MKIKEEEQEKQERQGRCKKFEELLLLCKGRGVLEAWGCLGILAYTVTVIYLLLLSLLIESIPFTSTLLFTSLTSASLLITLSLRIFKSSHSQNPNHPNHPNNHKSHFQNNNRAFGADLHSISNQNNGINNFIAILFILLFLFVLKKCPDYYILSLCFSIFAPFLCLFYTQFTFLYLIILALLLFYKAQFSVNSISTVIGATLLVLLLILNNNLNKRKIDQLKLKLENKDTYFASTVHELRNPLSS
jgi:hypothetical protein